MHACGLCGLVEIEDSEWKVSSLEFTMRGDNETEGDEIGVWGFSEVLE